MEIRTARICRILALALVLTCLLSLAFGSVWISPLEGIRALVSSAPSSVRTILLHLRLPRMVAALFAGAALAGAGVLIQNVLHNPLAAPNIIGIHSGAGLIVALVSCLFPAAWMLSVPAAFIGALAGCLLVFGIAWKARASRMTIVLAGLAVSQIFMACIDLLVSIDDDALSGYTDFRIGSLSGLTFTRILPGILCIAAGILLAVVLAGRMDLLELSEEQATSLGVPVRRWMLELLACAALLCGGAISYCGLIGFIGLLCPHIMRRLGISGGRDLLISSMLAGSLLLCLADLLSRVVFAPYEIPVGIVLSLCGGPFFLYLLLSERKNRHD